MFSESLDGKLMREFFGFMNYGSSSGANVSADSKVSKDTTVDNISYVVGSDLGSGTVSKSVENNVKCTSIEAEDCVLINVTCRSLKAKKGAIVYNVCIDDDIDMTEEAVICGVTTATGDNAAQIIMKSAMSIDGGKVWDEKVEGNSYDYAGIYALNADADPLTLEKMNKTMHADMWGTITK